MYICLKHNILYRSFEKYPFDGLIIIYIDVENILIRWILIKSGRKTHPMYKSILMK